MKLYIAGHSQSESIAVAKLCKAAGHQITCRWLDEDFSRTHEYTNDDKVRVAIVDAEDIAESDALVFLASPRRIPGGKFVEAGIAMGQGKFVYLLGHRENVLMYHPLVQAFDSVEDFLKANPASADA